MVPDPLLLLYIKELEDVKNKLYCSEHQLGDSQDTFCWVDVSQPNTLHYLMCTQDLQEWAKYLVCAWSYALNAPHVHLINCSTTLKIQTTPISIHPAHPISITFARHAKQELLQPSSCHLSSITTFTSHLLSTTCGLPTVHFLDSKVMALSWSLNHSKGHLHSTWRVMKKLMIMNCYKTLRTFLLLSILTTLLWTSPNTCIY